MPKSIVELVELSAYEYHHAMRRICSVARQIILQRQMASGERDELALGKLAHADKLSTANDGKRCDKDGGDLVFSHRCIREMRMAVPMGALH